MNLEDKKSYIDENQSIRLIPIHFEVPRNTITLDEFIASAESTRAIVNDFNLQLFDGKLKIEFIVIPPKEGSFLRLLGIAIKKGSYAVLTLTAANILDGILLDVTGMSTTGLAKEATRIVRTESADLKLKVETSVSGEDAVNLLAEITKVFYSTDDEALIKCGITKRKFRNAYLGRNKLYEKCYQNSDIVAIGFDDTEHFPVKRSDFPRLIVDVPEEEKEDDDLDWKTEITHIKVTSPNWERDANRQWKGRCQDKSEVHFTIEDESFWGLVESEKLSVKVKDSIKVQIAYISANGKKTKTRVLSVLEYNGKKISDPLNDEELKMLLNKHEPIYPTQGDMFTET